MRSKQRTISHLQTLASSPPLQGDKRSSQPSSELSSSEGCLVAEKIKEKERKWEKRKAMGKTPAQYFINGKKLSLITVQELIYCPSQAKLQKKTKIKSYYKGQIWKKTKKRTKWSMSKKVGKVNNVGG